MILAVDLGTTFIKAGLWEVEGLRAEGRAAALTRSPQPDWVEQDADAWWTGMRAATRAALDTIDGRPPIQAVSFSSARQTFVLVGVDGSTLTPALVWSDARAHGEGERLAEAMGAERVRQLTGLPLSARALPAKLAWLAAHRPMDLSDVRWVLGPRDLLVRRLTGTTVTDPTIASASGMYGPDGEPLPELAGWAIDRLAPVVPADSIAGELRPDAAEALGVAPGIPVVTGAGDRACEAIGGGASEVCPMVSWGTTANASLPVAQRPTLIPHGLALTRGAVEGWLLEAGLATAGSLLEWLGKITGHRAGDLAKLAEESPPGARGVTVVPWLGGARAPWWRDSARLAAVGFSPGHQVADLARAAMEGVAWDLRRCLEIMGPEGAPPFAELTVTGSSESELWCSLLDGITGHQVLRRRSGRAAMAGAALLGWRALGHHITVDQLDPVVERRPPDPSLRAVYEGLAPTAERLAEMLIQLPSE